MKAPPNYLVILVFVFAAFLAFANLWGLSLFSYDEAKNASAAMEMLQAENWVVPTYNGELRTEKPALHYYFFIAAYQVLGVNPFAARLFSAVFFLLTLFVSWWFSKRYAGKGPAFLVLLTLATGAHNVVMFHMAVPDPFLVFFLTIAFWSLYAFDREGKRWQWWAYYLSVGFATLAKGPVAIGLAGLVALVYFLWRKKLTWATLKKFHVFAGALVVLAVSAWWYVLVHIQTDGDFTRAFFLNQNLNRYGSTFEGHGGVYGLSVVFMLVGLLPLGIYLLPSLFRSFFRLKNDLVLVHLLVVLVTVGFFSFSGTQLPNYIAPAYASMALLLGLWVEEKSGRERAWRSFLPWLVLMLIFAVALPWVALNLLKKDPSLSVHSQVAWHFLALPAGALVALVFLITNRLRSTFLALAGGGWLALVVLFYFILPPLDGEAPTQQFASGLAGENELVAYRGLNPSFVFHTQGALPKAQNPAELDSLLEAHREAWVLTQRRYIPELQKQQRWDTLLLRQDLFEASATAILRPSLQP